MRIRKDGYNTKKFKTAKISWWPFVKVVSQTYPK
jgi:hypothetical protein